MAAACGAPRPPVAIVIASVAAAEDAFVPPVRRTLGGVPRPGVAVVVTIIIAHWSGLLFDDGSLRRSGLAADGGAAADRCRRLPLFGGCLRLLPFLPLRLLPAVLTPAVETGLELPLVLPAAFVISSAGRPSGNVCDR